jgi:NAD(P)-dependent dehydrogenase (short-subunit alcohol dehydrogenase family)
MRPFAELDEAEWDEVWDVNVKAAHLATQLVAGGMRAAGWGRVILLSAGSAYLRNHSIYGLAKQAITYFAEELAVELAPEITVNAVAPGQIAESAEDIAEHDPDFVARATASTPAGRLVTRPEVAELIAQLCGPAFAMVTGATLPVDGGWRLPRF